METSAKTGLNARNVLVEAAKILYNDYLTFDENNKKDDKKDDEKNKGKKKLIQANKKTNKGCCG